MEGLGDPAPLGNRAQEVNNSSQTCYAHPKIKPLTGLGERATAGHVACVISEEIVPKKGDHVAAPLSTESMD